MESSICAQWFSGGGILGSYLCVILAVAIVFFKVAVS
jgi:hypothetical protein